MDDTQLKEIAKHLVTDVIQKAAEYVRKERDEMAEMKVQLDQGVDDIVQLTIGRSITAIRSGQISPTDHKMAEMTGQQDKEVDDIVGKTIERSIIAIRSSQTSPTDRKMAEMAGQQNEEVDDIVVKTIERSIIAIRSGQTSPTDRKMAELTGQLDKDVDDIVEMTIGRSIAAIHDGQRSPTDHKMRNGEIQEKTSEPETGNDTELQKAAERDHKIGAPPAGATIQNKTAGKVKKNFFERHLDRILGREKKNTKTLESERQQSAPSGGSRKLSSKAHNKRIGSANTSCVVLSARRRQ
ncbi:uncharacterized protein LOC117322018 isoform X2 [Pecten maximus]|uniref:uncharacterized protein LOC117322018 isoform X2 n=1 Tax=Pecten maximus TaxID=6579 RepID=UPI0014586CBC|nr:uncharacterized protein LOC117322018 isoform X2 [Pecten maximus]